VKRCHYSAMYSVSCKRKINSGENAVSVVDTILAGVSLRKQSAYQIVCALGVEFVRSQEYHQILVSVLVRQRIVFWKKKKKNEKNDIYKISNPCAREL
jgi:hypothetical protein